MGVSMQRNQKLNKDGYQVLGFPMEIMNITQGNNGQFSHQGVNALDIAGRDTGIEPTFAPCDMHYVANDSYTNGNAIFFESNGEVMFADGTINFATFMFIHDDYIADILAVQNFEQGQEFGDEGTAGYATGNHCHFEVAKGKFTHMYDRNAQGTYHLPNSISADLACVIDGTTIIDGNGMNWRTLSDLAQGATPNETPSDEPMLNDIPSDFIRENATFYPETTIKIREAPSINGNDTGFVYEKGMSVQYDGFVKREGYVWISWVGSSGNRRWMACGELNDQGVNVNPYGTFR